MQTTETTLERESMAQHWRPFRYEDAPFDPVAPAAAALYRSVDGADSSLPGPGSFGLGDAAALAELAIPVRFEYRAGPGDDLNLADELNGEAQPEDTACGEAENGSGHGPTTAGSGSGEAGKEQARDIEERMMAECAAAEARGRSQGLEVGLARGREEGRRDGHEEAIRQLHRGTEAERQRLQEQAGSLLRSFARARESYIARMEEESARLALAIAARLLRRELESDPLLMTGAMRVALGQLAASTAVRLRVPERDATLWKEALAHMPNLPLRPEVIGDPALKPGDCCMETELGVAELGMDSQLAEVERRFFETPAEDRSTMPLPRPIVEEGAVHGR